MSDTPAPYVDTVPVSDGTTLPVHVAEPAGGAAAKGAVVVIQEAFGVNAHIVDVTSRFAEAGWYAVAPHLFHRDGDPLIPYGELAPAMEQVAKLTREGLLADLDAVAARLAEAGFAAERTGIVGFCMGGSVAISAASERTYGAAVSFYGGGVASGRFGFDPQPELAGRLRAPFLGLYGDRDRSIPVDEVERLRAALDAAPVEAEIVRYPEGGHGFHNDVRADHYDATAAPDAWQRTLAWFEARLLVA